ncbi:MAG: hypothetical protein LC676_11010 [Loktanella sp.]|nr:hypothetical protein [Loktanella sp.]
MTDKTPIAEQVFGDNKAPIDDALAADYADAQAMVDDMVRRFEEEAPAEIAGDQDMLAIGAIITDARKLTKQIDAARTREGKPLYDAKRSVDFFFKDMIARLEKAEKVVQERADAYTRRKQAEEREIARRRAEEARQREEDARRRAEESKSAEAGGRAAARAETFSAEADQQTKTATTGGAKVSGGGVTASARATWTFNTMAVAADFADPEQSARVSRHLNRYIAALKDAGTLHDHSVDPVRVKSEHVIRLDENGHVIHATDQAAE